MQFAELLRGRDVQRHAANIGADQLVLFGVECETIEDRSCRKSILRGDGCVGPDRDDQPRRLAPIAFQGLFDFARRRIQFDRVHVVRIAERLVKSAGGLHIERSAALNQDDHSGRTGPGPRKQQSPQRGEPPHRSECE